MSETITFEAEQRCFQDEDQSLVSTAQQNPAAFKQLYVKWMKQVYRYFYFRVGSEKDAEDLTSQVFLKAYEDLPRYRDRGSFSAWLFSIAHARLVDFYRKGKRYVPLEDAELEFTAPDLLTETAQQDEIRQVLHLMRGLAEEEQELIRLRFMANLGFREIGLVLKRKEDAVRKSLSRLLSRMQAQLEADHE